MNVERTHDKFYLDEARRKKEYFKILYNYIRTDTENQKVSDLLDIGCATGDFLFYAKDELPNFNLFGLEVMPELAKKIDFGPNVLVGNILDKDSLPKRKFDIITMLGVISIFDDFQPVLDNILTLMKEDSVCYIFGIFNPEDLDVIIKSRKSSEAPLASSVFESGWNCFSKKSIELYLAKKNVRCEFIPFDLGLKIEKNKDDPLRSWTEGDVNSFYIVKNGLQLIHNFYFLKISTKK